MDTWTCAEWYAETPRSDIVRELGLRAGMSDDEIYGVAGRLRDELEVAVPESTGGAGVPGDAGPDFSDCADFVREIVAVLDERPARRPTSSRAPRRDRGRCEGMDRPTGHGPEEDRKMTETTIDAAGTIDHPAGWTPPAGYHFGAHLTTSGGSGYYLIREADGLATMAIERPDMEDDDAPSEAMIDATIDGDEDALRDAIALRDDDLAAEADAE